MSIAQQQMVEIAKALSLNARLIIMDEPTSSLTLTETKRLLELVCELSGQGVSIIYISHRLGEIERMRRPRGRACATAKTPANWTRGEFTHDKLVSLMVGREIKSFYVEPEADETPGYFKVRNASSPLHPGKTVSFDAARGEILGFAGLVGAGRSEMAKAIVGLDNSPREGNFSRRQKAFHQHAARCH